MKQLINMSESSANLEILDNEDIYSVCVLMKQDVVPILNTLKMVYSIWMNLIKISQGILRTWKYAVLIHIFFLLHACPKQKRVHWGCYRWTPSPIVCIGVSSPLLGNPPLYIGFLWPTPPPPVTKNCNFLVNSHIRNFHPYPHPIF